MSINWPEVGVLVAVVYPPMGLIYRWMRHIEVRFDQLRQAIQDLSTSDKIDVRDLTTFKDDVGRRLLRIEGHLWH